MHEVVSLVHVPLHKRFILLGIPTADDKIVLAGNKPDKLLKPEHLPIHSLDLLLLQLLKVSSCCLLSLLYGYICGILSLKLLLMRLLPDFKVFHDVQVGGDG